jgi:hypothetical protein
MNRHVATHWRAIGAGALGIAGALVGCNIVVDAGSYHVGDFGEAGAAGEGGTMSPPGEGGAGGDGSSVSPPGSDGGSGADGGSQAQSEGGVGGGGDGACGSVPLPTTTAFQQIVNACVLASSCDPDFFAVNISTCVTDDYLHAYGSLGCLASITSCADYYSCQSTAVATPSDCTDTSSDDDVGTCSAGVATSCYYFTGDFNTITNCSALGGTCTVYDTDSDGDQAAGCLLGSCSDTDNNLHCLDNEHVYTCVNGRAYGQTCPSASICGTISGSSSCYYQSPSCSTPGSTCSQQTLSICSASDLPSAPTNETVNYNCGTSGLQCETDDAGSGQCVSPGCESSQCTESCDDTTGIITLCVGGVPDTYDCTQNGFTSCGSGSPTGSTIPFAYCTY